MRRRLSLSLSFAALLVLCPPAHAGWFGGEALTDGVSAVGGVDLGRDGQGAVAYLKQDGGVPHAFVSRKVDGVWLPPERVDAGLGGAATEAVVAAGEDHKLAVAFISGGAVYGAVAPEGAAPQPFASPALLQAADLASPHSGLHADLGPNGYAYATWAGPGGGGGDVRAARLAGTTWTAVPGPLDIDPARSAGRGASRPRVAVGADGNAIVVWGEEHPDGRTRVFERRLIGTRLSAVPQEASLGDLGGAPGGSATLPDVDIEDDSSFAQVTWSQPFGGVQRSLMRRLVGSAFEAPVTLDDGSGSGAPDAGVDGRGQGYAVAATGGGALLGYDFDDEVVGPAERLDALGGVSQPVTAVGELGERAIAWASGAEVRGRFGVHDEPFAAEAVLSRPDLPAPTAPLIAADLAGDALVAFGQGDRVVVAENDRAPGKPAGGTTTSWQRRKRPELRWGAGTELWGPQVFTVVLNGEPIATAQGDRDRVRPPARVPDGEHTWAVAATDRRGQTTLSDPRPLRIDRTRPALRLRIRGARRPGALLRFRVRVRDTSGVDSLRLDFGDGTAASLTKSRHRFRAGLHLLRLSVTDQAGNTKRKRFRLRIG